MKYKIIIILTLLVHFVFVISSCKKEDLQTFECSGIKPTYNIHIKKILDSNCATTHCHSANQKADGIDLSSYSSVKALSSNKNFLGSIQHIKGFEQMPKDATKMPDSTIKTISCWVQNGSPE